MQDNREVSREEGLKFARRHQTLFIEASAKTKDGVECAFEELVHKVMINVVEIIFDNIVFIKLQIIQTPGLWETFSDGILVANKDHMPNSSCSSYCTLV